MDACMNVGQLKEIKKKVRCGYGAENKKCLERLIYLAEISNTPLETLLLFYMTKNEELLRENQDFRCQISRARAEMVAGENSYRNLAKALEGFKTAYEDIDVDFIIDLSHRGYTFEAIAYIMGVSVSTIARRLSEHKQKLEQRRSKEMKQKRSEEMEQTDL